MAHAVTNFDADAAAQPGSGIFGLPTPPSPAEATITLLPVPFDATTSYGAGTARGPEAILAASAQVDLYDLQYGRIYEAGIYMADVDEEIRHLGEKARALAEPIVAKGGAHPESAADARVLAEVLRASEFVNEFTYARTKAALDAGKIPALVGGDHSTPFGAIRACAERSHDLGILQIDAHMDLRDAYEGFQFSHASIMHNVLTRVSQVTRLVQVGIRDFGEGEYAFAKTQGPRVLVHFDQQLRDRMDEGEKWAILANEIIAPLPRDVYVSFDIDGLEPALCPHTGTPVPGGLTFHQAAALFKVLADSGRRIVGFDLVEVTPGASEDEPDPPEWDANVGARLLYKMCGMAAASNGIRMTKLDR